MEENTITIGVATYTISRYFGHQTTKQNLLCSLIAQKLDDGKSVDPGDTHGV